MRYAVFLTSLCGLALGVIAGPTQAADAFPLFERRVGAWVVAAFTGPDTGPFTHCILSTRTRENTDLYFSLNRNRAASVRVAPWSLPDGTQEPVTYQVDDNEALSGPARGIGNGIGVPLPRSTPLFDQLSAGKILRMQFAGEVRQFDLAGLPGILPALADCVQRFRDDGVEALASPPPAAMTDEPAALRRTAAEAADWARQITADGAMPRVKLLSAEQMARGQWDDFFKKSVAGWYSSKIIGALAVHRLRHRSLEAAAYAWSGALRTQCDNDYTLDRHGRDDLVVGFHIDCHVESRRERYAAAMFVDRNAFLWLSTFKSAAVGPENDVEIVAENFRRAALARLAR
jgi:hypothetical protein